LLLVAGTVGAHGAAFAAEQMAPLAARIIAAEGGPGDNPLSSASGYGQFLRDTWLDVFRRAYPRLALILTGEQILALREVKPLAEQLTDRFAQDNAVALRQLGLPASDATLSLAHAVGGGGAISVLTLAPGRPLRELLSPQAIEANPAFGGMTAEQLRHWAMTRVAATAATLANQSPTTASREEGAAAPRHARGDRAGSGFPGRRARESLANLDGEPGHSRAFAEFCRSGLCSTRARRSRRAAVVATSGQDARLRRYT
jgi:hypothetical protein